MRVWLEICWVALFATAAAGPGYAEPTGMNVVLITMDTTRADALGSYGQPLLSSPNLDRLAAEGALFLQCASSAPTTLPSHATIFTGNQPYVHGARSNWGQLPAGNVTLAEVLKQHGYATGAQVSAPVVNAKTGLQQGFDHYVDEESEGVERWKLHDAVEGGSVAVYRRSATDISSHGIRFIRKHQQEKFLLWLHYFDPHAPFSPPPAVARFAPGSPYHGEIRYVDQQIQRVVAEIERLGLRDKTLVVITADHGESLGEHGEQTHAYFVYEATIRVPLILWGAGVPAGQRIDSLVRTIDIAPTVLSMLGLPQLEQTQGVSLVPLLDGQTRDLGIVAYGETLESQAIFETSILRYLREGRWKYIHKLNPELFDLEADPDELHNRAAEHPEIVERLRERLTELIAAAPPRPVEWQAMIDEKRTAQLQALGYVAGPSTQALGDELAALELTGADPVAKIADHQQMVAGLDRSLERDYAASAVLLRGVLERNPKSRPILMNLIEAVRKLKRPDELVSLYRRLIDLEPTADAYFQLARFSFRRGKHSEAESLLESGLSLEPCAASERAALARLVAKREDFVYSAAVLKEGVERCPHLHTLSNNYAYLLATNSADEVRDGAEALRIAKQITTGSNARRPEYLDTLAAAYAEVGDFANAVKTAEQLVAQLEAKGTQGPAIAAPRRHLELFREGRPVRE